MAKHYVYPLCGGMTAMVAVQLPEALARRVAQVLLSQGVRVMVTPSDWEVAVDKNNRSSLVHAVTYLPSDDEVRRNRHEYEQGDEARSMMHSEPDCAICGSPRRDPVHVGE